MKLNIGCGKTYRDGFINIDAFDQTVADRIMPADNLKFPSNSIDEIEACQLIEHLGVSNTIYALAEWFRVLEPNGKLLLETPDLITSFKRFIGGNRETRKAVISWIYGLETLGMSHKFCFPDELIVELLEKNGFVEIKKSYSNTLGIDLGSKVIATVCGSFDNQRPTFYGREVRGIRRHYQYLRTELGKKHLLKKIKRTPSRRYLLKEASPVQWTGWSR
jgi:hypothetical protein